MSVALRTGCRLHPPSSLLLIISLITLVTGHPEDDSKQPQQSKINFRKRDLDCSADGSCGTTYQDAFCSHAPSRIVKDSGLDGNSSGSYIDHDYRYRIHTFGLAHGTLYIFAAGALFSVPVGHPPFAVSYGLNPFDLSNQLPNNFYRTYRPLNYNFATLVLELDANWQLFLVAGYLNDLSTLSQMWHTQQVIRSRRHSDHFEAPPGVFALGFNAFFGDGAKSCETAVEGEKKKGKGKVGRGCTPFTLDRIIAGERFFFHIRQRTIKKKTAKNKEDKVDVTSADDHHQYSSTVSTAKQGNQTSLKQADVTTTAGTTNETEFTSTVNTSTTSTTTTPAPDPIDEGKDDPHFYTITRYEQPPLQVEGQSSNFSFKLAEYVIYPAEKCAFQNTTKSWYLERKDRLTEEQINQLLPVSSNWYAARFPLVMLKNGYIHGGKMYLSKLDFIEVYSFAEVEVAGENGGPAKFLISWESTLASQDVLSCRLWDAHNTQYRFTTLAGYVLLATILVLSVFVTVNKINSGPSRRYLNGNRGGQLIYLTDAMVYSGGGGGGKSDGKKKKR